MADIVKPDSATVQQQLQKSRDLWSSYAPAASELRLPIECVQLQKLLSRVPAFPNGTLQTHETPSTLQYHHSSTDLRIRGTSTWCTSLGECSLPPKTIQLELLCGVKRSVGCSFAEYPSFDDWPGVQEEEDGQRNKGNHLTILLLAWAYILSARWVELQSPHSSMNYLDLQAIQLGNEDLIPDAIEVDIGERCESAVRWWTAILAPGEGWRASIEQENKTYRSPWSAYIASSQCLKLQNTHPGSITYDQSELPPSSDQALGYLVEYCELHGINSQCTSALAASLFLPWRNSDRAISVVLPLPKPPRIPVSNSQQKSLHFESGLLPYYMTLSCNTRGLRALLCGTLFDPAVPCNLVSPWMQPIFEIIDPIIARKELTSLVTIMSKRQPILAPLWLGAVIMGMEKTILQPVRGGQFATELHAAAWTGTIHSFINSRPPTSHAPADNEISRPDECRLLFLTGSQNHPRAPVSPWPPFGSTQLCLVNIEVRQHATCQGHCLQYISWRWDTDHGLSDEDRGFYEQGTMAQWHATEFDSVPISTTLFLSSDELSAVATRSIFSWLRPDGYPPDEKNIFTHDWFDIGSSSEESACSSDNDSPVAKGRYIEMWLDQTS